MYQEASVLLIGFWSDGPRERNNREVLQKYLLRISKKYAKPLLTNLEDEVFAFFYVSSAGEL